MCPWLTRAAVLATLIITQLPGTEVAAQSGPPARSLPAHAVVERLVEHRQDLALDSLQVTRLTQLAHRLRTNPGRLRITSHSRVPGKASPRVEREPISPREALRRALRVLTPEQRVAAARLVQSDTVDMARR
ncbi:MAG: hypothetical protein H0T50_10590 [Gemmatimonadales bacterium]|nr:hypothetical protein [Gemmatimonadales bacterium]